MLPWQHEKTFPLQELSGCGVMLSVLCFVSPLTMGKVV